ncbi:isoprenyl transferase [Pelomicrobium sp. G1]|jgi:undecaprenyl diphosphate synthase|uniref:isoprenyl transferase n=1 Tax=unclassified Pelomicrobium TaxID=2815318 RepID=UPI000AD9A21B|nr:MAG: isoprenyl transferase [Burkholderiales bacterium]
MSEHQSSTLSIPPVGAIPRHIAVIMDGNGRWARRRFLPRVAGHRKGMEAVRATVRACGELGVEYLTLFAFSSENWRRPKEEVNFLMQLFVSMLEQEVVKLHENGIRLKVVGSREGLEERLVRLIEQAEALTRSNRRLTLTVAVNYGGRWDIMQAVQRMLQARPELATRFAETDLTPYLAMSYAPEPDLFIRTGGEQRVSNFLLWQLAYTELYFTDILWPDFDARALHEAILWYQQRERRFGRTSEQLAETLERRKPA